MDKHRKWNFEEEKHSDLLMWIESILGAAALLVLFMAVMIMSTAFI